MCWMCCARHAAEMRHHIVTTLCMREDGDMVCNGPNCSPCSWMERAYPPKRWHLLRMEGSFDLQRGSVIMTRYINEMIYRIRDRQWRRIRGQIDAISSVLPLDCVSMVSSYLFQARRSRSASFVAQV